MTAGTAQLGSPAACLVRFHPALRRSPFFLAASTVGILDVIQIDNRTGAFFLAFLVCPALLVIVTKYCDDRSFFEFHLFDAFTDLTKSLDLQVDPPVIVLLTAIIFAVSDLENSKPRRRSRY